MDATLYAGLRQRELLAEAERARIGRLAALARRCREACRPSRFRRLASAIVGREASPATC